MSINDHHTSLLSKRSEMVILSSIRYHMKMDSVSIPHLPDVGVQYSKIELAALDDQLEEDASFRSADEVSVDATTYSSDDSKINNESVDN